MNEIALSMQQAALESNLWCIEEAKKILDKIGNKVPDKGYVLFASGYGPSGLPHMGTFCDVMRVSFVRQAFCLIAPHIPTRLFVISDDLDGMRKVPETLPNAEQLYKHLHKPLSSVPDPFGTHESYGAGMNARVVQFLADFGFKKHEEYDGKESMHLPNYYTFISATEYYKSGKFDEYLIRVAKKYDTIVNDVILPTLGDERQQTYSPFMPIDAESGIVLSSGVMGVDAEKGTITYKVNDREKTIPFTGGNCKLQWKCDFGMRWAAMDVDFEMYGKDHYPNEPIYRKICQLCDKTPPVNFFYELFLDVEGRKISKSKGNGMSMDEWLKYGIVESLSYYMFLKPRTAKRLHFDVVPKAVDEYLQFLSSFKKQPLEEQINNPVYYVNILNLNDLKEGDTLSSQVKDAPPLSFAILLNIAATCNPETPEIIWSFLKRYDRTLVPGYSKILDQLVEKALVYYKEKIEPYKQYHTPTDIERTALIKLYEVLESYVEPTENHAVDLQNLLYQTAKDCDIEAKDWFLCLYQTLLGLPSGPRFGTFIAIYGVENTRQLIAKIIGL